MTCGRGSTDPADAKPAGAGLTKSRFGKTPTGDRKPVGVFFSGGPREGGVGSFSC